MVSSAMAVQDQSEGTQSNADSEDQIFLDASPQYVQGVQSKELLPSGSEYALKVRKPYTITKQRERWTEEEHKKFLEALKLYGRTWRLIEEHVGTKTAIQIRSHAQKFFSKVVRESGSSDAGSVKPIEIPPPRPKRKPIHPYPRKIVAPVKPRILVPETLRRSASPNFSASDEEQQSPTSVLSAVGPETPSTTDSTTPNGSLSPVSSTAAAHPSGFSLYEAHPSAEENRSLSQAPVKLELFPQDSHVVKGSPDEAASIQSLKLFGKIVLVTDSQRPSSPTVEPCKPVPMETDNGTLAHSLPWNLVCLDNSLLRNSQFTRNSSLSEALPTVCYMPFPNENVNLAEAGSSTPGCGLYRGMMFPLFPIHVPVAIKAATSPVSGQTEDREIQKEGSWSSLNSGSINAAGGTDKNWDVETQSHQRSSDKSSSSKRKVRPEKSPKGFVPYKRCLAQRDSQTLSLIREEAKD